MNEGLLAFAFVFCLIVAFAMAVVVVAAYHRSHQRAQRKAKLPKKLTFLTPPVEESPAPSPPQLPPEKPIERQIPAEELHPLQPLQLRPKPARAQPTQRSAVSRDVQGRLINMVIGDVAAAHRLVDVVRAANPGRSEQWYWEKAIEDLIRDRR